MYNMRLNFYFISIQLIILCHQYDFINMEPMIGQNIRYADVNEFPYVVSMVQLFAQDRNNIEFFHLCTGTLITRKDVAISYHCIEGEYQSGIQISVGSLHYEQGAKFRILWWLSYDQWVQFNNLRSRTQGNDIANIRLIEPVRNSITPVQLVDIPNVRLYNEEAVVVGWGAPNNTRFNPILRTATVKILTPNECKRRIRNIIRQNPAVRPEQHLCSAANPYVLLNQGDSGGPLLFHNRLVGITSGNVPNVLEETNPLLLNLHLSLEVYKTFYLNVMDSSNN